MARGIPILLLLLATFVASTSVIAIKASTTAPVLLAAMRLGIAALVLSPFYLRARRRLVPGAERRILGRAVVPGVLLFLHFTLWNAGARMTPAANASMIVNLVPLAMPFLLVFMVGEFPTRREWAGTAIVLTGLLLLGVGDFQIEPRYLVGDGVCFASMLAYAGYLTAGRRNRDIPGIWLYIVPVYAVAGICAFGVSFFTTNPFRAYPPQEWLVFLYLGLGPTVLGHSLFNFCLKHVRGQTMALVNQTQPLWAAVMAFWILNERPAPVFPLTAALLIAGVTLVVTGRREAGPVSPEASAASRTERQSS